MAEAAHAVPHALHPDSSSWLNLIERWFREITDKRIRRGVFGDVPELIDGDHDLHRGSQR